MSTTTVSESVLEAQRAIFGVLQPYQKDLAVMQRIQAYVVLKKGKKLTEYLNNGATDEDKLELLNELTTIVTEKNWDALPPAAVGQATAPSAPRTRATTPLLKKAEPVAATPAIDTMIDHASPTTPAVTEQRPPVAPKALDLFAAAIAAMNAEKASDAPTISEDQVRKIVRAELADVLERVASVLRQ